MTRGADLEGRSVGLATAASVWRSDTDAEPTLEALARAGVRAEPVVWDDPSVDWARFDLVVVRSTWDYVGRREQFLDWAERVAAVTDLANPAPVLRWNTDKSYLLDLAERGVPVVPTVFVRAVEHRSDPAATAERVRAAVADLPGPQGDVVVKPTVSAGAKDTVRRRPGQRTGAVDHALSLLRADRDVMVQPYLSGVDTAGETGMVHFAGSFSHAFRKGALLEPGGAEVSGLYAEEEIGPRRARAEELAVAERALAAGGDRLGTDPRSLLYARTDVLPGPGGRPVLLELELTEPSFFLAADPGAAERFAAACRRRLGLTGID